jgi:hypothetical protein
MPKAIDRFTRGGGARNHRQRQAPGRKVRRLPAGTMDHLTGDYLWRSSAKVGAGKFRRLRPLQPA